MKSIIALAIRSVFSTRDVTLELRVVRVIRNDESYDLLRESRCGE